MVYKQGVNKVVNDEVFPYPLKCWYDDENIYVQVLRIPEPEECKLSPYVMKGVRDGLYDINNYSTREERCAYYGRRGNYLKKLCICLEIKQSRNLKYSSSHRNSITQEHSGRGGNFIHKSQNDFSRAVKNQIYTFPLSNYFNLAANRAYETMKTEYPCFTRVRATFRFLRYGKYNTSKFCLDRTGLYSNIINIKK